MIRLPILKDELAFLESGLTQSGNEAGFNSVGDRVQEAD
jgi:hypothetical protein